jgi:hypothetical protein
MTQLRAFVAGFLSTLVFHQGLLALLHGAGATPLAPFDLSATAPLGVPRVISLAFWGGIWAIVLWQLIRRATGWRHWLTALVLGAVAPSVVALCVVYPLKGLPLAAGADAKIWAGALLLNGVWGLGVALLMRVLPKPAV